MSSSVLVLGLGGLGSTCATLLARAGVGRLVLVDDGKVELSNLHRQVLYDESDLGRSKATAARAHLRKVVPEAELVAKVLRVKGRNIEGLIEDIDVVIDGTDNMETRRVINDACVKHKVPWVYGGVEGTCGMSMTVVPGKTPCLNCVFPERKQSASKTRSKVQGVMNSLVSIIGAIQSTEAIKLILGKATRRGLLVIDDWDWEARTIKINIRKNCSTCVGRVFPILQY